MATEPLGRYMTTEPLDEWSLLIRNKQSRSPLGRIVWYAPWRQWIMEPAGHGIVFNNQCLRDIAARLDGLNERGATALLATPDTSEETTP